MKNISDGQIIYKFYSWVENNCESVEDPRTLQPLGYKLNEEYSFEISHTSDEECCFLIRKGKQFIFCSTTKTYFAGLLRSKKNVFQWLIDKYEDEVQKKAEKEKREREEQEEMFGYLKESWNNL